MEYITLSDLTQIGIFLCSFALVVLKVVSLHNGNKRK